MTILCEHGVTLKRPNTDCHFFCKIMQNPFRSKFFLGKHLVNHKSHQNPMFVIRHEATKNQALKIPEILKGRRIPKVS